MSAPPADAPLVSIVIPVYNEEGILREAVTRLRQDVGALPWTYEIILCENGSSDQTVTLARHLSGEFSEVTWLSIGEPNYGRAMRAGILAARGTYVVCEEIDLCDVGFYRRSMDLLLHGDAELVVGSKAMKGAHDQRPLFRRAATRVINGMFRVAVGFRGTDTHGQKAFVRERLVPIAHACVVDKDLLASELVIRAGRAGVHTVEIPVSVAEKRRPAIHLIRRVPQVLRGLVRLTYAIRVRPSGDTGPTTRARRGDTRATR